MKSILQAHISQFHYPGMSVPALTGINLEVQAGEFIVVTGPAGSGKSTLCHCLTGVIPKTVQGQFDGTVRLNDIDLAGMPLPRVSGHVGLVNQNPDTQLFNVLVQEDVAFGPENLQLSSDEILGRVQKGLEATGTEHLRLRFSHLLSGGQSQRVVLSSVLSLGANILVLDQPAAELDPEGRRMIYENIHLLNRDSGYTIILVEDRLGDIAKYADRIILLDRGRIVADLPPRAFFADTQLAEYGIRIPDTVSLYHALAAAGVPLAALPLTPAELTEQVGPLQSSAIIEPSLPAGSGSAPARSEPVVEIADVVYRYGTGLEALSGVSLTVGRQEYVAIVGENGAGKTTLAKHIIGLLRPTAGRVKIAGEDIRTRPVHEIGRQVGYLFQDPDYQIFNNSCFDEVAYGLKMRRLPADEVKEKTLAALAELDLSDYADDHPYTLSRGQRQRLAVASVLAARPPILVVDEPSTGLDYRESLALMDCLERYRRAGGTVITITHDMDMAVRFAHRIVVMAGGNILRDVPAAEISAHLDILAGSAIILPDLATIVQSLGLSPRLRSVQEVADAIRAARKASSQGSSGIAARG